ncbi:hypothetical protein KY285_032275 [Solanum tuberosum]|nr:hypothetical protein KY289_032412 [Solanum tuberosum]KAH0647027.1 hypothetical protein KY285_032275 [Solanum tuberosum]
MSNLLKEGFRSSPWMIELLPEVKAGVKPIDSPFANLLVGYPHFVTRIGLWEGVVSVLGVALLCVIHGAREDFI